MKINIKSTNIDLTPELKDYIQQKMDMLEKFLGNIDVINCDVEVGINSTHHLKGKIYKTEAMLEVPGQLLRIEKNEKDLNKSIDKAKDHLARSIKRYKQKIIEKSRNNSLKRS